MKFEFTRELELLREGDRSQTLLEKIINKYQNKLLDMKDLYERYEGVKIPIIDRCVSNPQDINNNIPNDFFKEIVDTKAGYFAGTPASYIFEEKVQAAKDRFDSFAKRNRLSDLEYETVKMAAICGYSGRLVYIREDTLEEGIVNILPWECLFLGDYGIDEPEYALRFYKVEDLDGTDVYKVQLYEAGKVTYYKGDSFSTLNEEGSIDTPFAKCNLFGYENNAELRGDAENVLHLIDGYDNTMSDVNSEIEAFRGAYLAFYGVQPPMEGEEDSFKKAGTFYFQSDGMGGTKQDGKFITKELQTDAVEAHLNRLENNIYRFSQTPNMKDENFGGTITGVALEMKLRPLENKTAAYERKSDSADMRMLECLASSFGARGATFDPYTDVNIKHVRNVPLDNLYEAQSSAMWKGLISEETRLSMIPFVTNPKEEMDKMNEEAANNPYFGLEDITSELSTGTGTLLEQTKEQTPSETVEATI